ncbi:MAG: helix-turn-helix domain-containing protein [Gemmatimonadota bacterium]|nr:helix-turn-helix domain-containing protein [Gemmatimonadota bacterium]
MNRAAMLREVRMEAFERVYGLWRQKLLVQAQAARLLKMSERTFRRWVVRYEAEGPAALRDRRVGCSARRAPPEEVAAVEALYRAGHRDWNVRHFYDGVYVPAGGGMRSYTWVKNRLQEAGLVKKGRRKGPHRERRDRKPAAGQMLHQDASTHAWVPGESWDLVVTMDDATGEVLSGFFVEEEGTWSSFRGCVRRWRRGGCSTACTRTGARTTGIRRRRAGRWTRATRPSSAGRWRSWGSR